MSGPSFANGCSIRKHGSQRQRGRQVIKRKGEGDKTWYRTDRCFRVGEDWYIATREGKDIGPFKSRVTAERSAERLIAILSEERKDVDAYTRKLVLEGIWADTHFA